MRFRLMMCILAAFSLLVSAVGAQDSEPLIAPADADTTNPLANISFPPPVYVVRDSVDIRGTANLPNQRNYYIEFRQMNLGMVDAGGSESVWFPATLPSIAPVVDDVLGAWDTVRLDDGLYELQLRIITSIEGEEGEEPERVETVARVSPIRVQNNPPEFAMDMLPETSSATMPAETAETAPADPTEEPTAEMAEEPANEMPEPTPEIIGPYVVVTVPGANVRSGDATVYPIIGALLEGDTAPIKGVSSWNTGWWYIDLPNGRSGFIAPFIVNVEGDASNVPAVQPPPLPATAIPTAIPQPTAPPAPTSGPNLIIEGSPVISPHPATCNQPYSISVRIKNVGNARSGGGLIEIVDARHDGAGREVTYSAFRELDPGQAAVSQATITPKVHHSELHHINFHVDYDNRVAETNENDNRAAAAPYSLLKGSCP